MAEPTAAQPAGRDWIGYRIAWWRDRAGLSQRQLAERLGHSRQYVQMIESGRRQVATRRLVADFAAALGISITDLTAQPIAPRNPDEMVMYGLAPAIRRALDGEDPPPDQPRSLADLAAAVDRSLALRMAADWDTLAGLMPGLITETAAADGDAGRLLHVQAVANASWSCQTAGYLDLARRCADRAVEVGDLVGEPVHAAAAAYSVSQASLAGGSARHALATAETAAERLQGAGSDSGDTAGIATMLHLQSALSAGALSQPDRAADHLAEAADVAGQITGDPWHLEAGPTNVAVWTVAVSCELGDWGRAPELAAAVDTTRLRTADRVSRLHVDAGRGWYETGNPDRAVEELLVAMDTSARATRVLPCVRELTSQLARDVGPRGGSAELARLVSWVGVDPLVEA